MKYILIALVLYGCIDSTRGEVSLSNYSGWMVAEKKQMREINDGTINAWWVYLERDHKIKVIRTVKYWYDKYNVGDTINGGQHNKGEPTSARPCY